MSYSTRSVLLLVFMGSWQIVQLDANKKLLNGAIDYDVYTIQVIDVMSIQEISGKVYENYMHGNKLFQFGAIEFAKLLKKLVIPSQFWNRS